MSSYSSFKGYSRATRTATYGFLAALPLLIAYESLIVLVNAGPGGVVHAGAEVWLKQLLWMLGVGGHLVLGAVVLAIGAVIFWRERKKHIPIRSRYFFGLFVESCIYAVGLAIIVSRVVGLLFAMIPAVGAGTLTMVALSIGAGLYEELLFRVVLVSGLFVLIRRLFNVRRFPAYAAAALLAAFCFSAVHYIGPLGDVFTPASFTFRFLFGLALNVLYVTRGFAVAAWTHTLYDLMLVLS